MENTGYLRPVEGPQPGMETDKRFEFIESYESIQILGSSKDLLPVVLRVLVTERQLFTLFLQ